MDKKRNIAIIGTVGLPAKYGGFETLANHLVSNLREMYSFTVYCTKKRYKKSERLNTYEGAKLKYVNLRANGIQSILYDAYSILHALLYADILLILGVAGVWVLPFVRLFTNKKIIVSIDGIEWKREKWSLPAQLYLRWAEKIAVYYSHIDISDNESIQNYTGLRYGTLSRVIEYGGDHVKPVAIEQKDRKTHTFIDQRYAFTVCRIEPENNIEMILEAFSGQNLMNLVVVGNWNNSLYGKRLRKKYTKSRLILLDGIYDQRELDVLRSNACLYVHGHSAGGTNPSLVEAMSLGLPIIAFDVSYNRVTTERQALYFKTSTDLVSLIESNSEQRLLEVGIKMRTIAKRRYNWARISKQYHNLFVACMSSSTKPALSNNASELPLPVLSELNANHLKYTKLFYES
ncbi:MAG: DUF1972 domain-containing protein [Bacteroidia bacterium]|nr:DUF1972 domain-containing protein [Bacteroidia bacterium]